MFKKLKEILLQQLRQGAHPHGLALSCAIGCIYGTFPIFGTTTALCFLTIYFSRLNQPAAQAMNYLMGPLQLVLIPVFIKAGAWLWQVPAVSLNPKIAGELMWNAPRVFLAQYGLAALQSVCAWLVYAPFAGGLAYGVCLLVFKRLEKLRRLKH